MEGRIVKNVSNDYVVSSGGQNYLCKARGKLRNLKITPLVGDWVSFDANKKYLIEIFPRKNCLRRPMVANVEQAIIVCSTKMPSLDTYLLDKLLVIISFNKIKPIICFTKIDLLNEQEWNYVKKVMDYYKNINYMVVTNEKRENFTSLFQNKVTVLTGQSGAGKSSLLNFLNPKLNLKTDTISQALNRGKHTTRHTELYELLGGYVVDTPGFSQVDFSDMKRSDIRDNMYEMFEYLEKCKYRDCMHLKEEGCMVKKLYNEGVIARWRYENYRTFLEKKKDGYK